MIQKQVVFRQGEAGYDTFRVPAIVTAGKRNVVVFAEGRVSGPRDDGEIHLVQKRSVDGGKTFGPVEVLVRDQKFCQHNGNGNPTPVFDALTGRLLLLFRKGFTRVFAMRSDDAGATWSGYREITSETKRRGMKWFMTGPGHGVQLRSGRLVVGGAHTTDGPWPVYSPDPEWLKSHVLFSDDHGETWRMGGQCGHCSDECMPAELADGRVMMSLRNGDPKKRRAFSFSEDGGETFGPMVWSKDLKDPMCMAGLLRVGKVLAHVGPHHVAKRRNMTLLLSRDEGKTWGERLCLHRGPSAYADLALLPGKKLGVLYECGREKYWETITLAMTEV